MTGQARDGGNGAPGSAAPGSHTFEVVDSEILVESPILALRRDQVRMPGGKISSREVVEQSIRGGFEPHFVVVKGHHAETLTVLAEMFGFEVCRY